MNGQLATNGGLLALLEVNIDLPVGLLALLEVNIAPPVVYIALL